MGRRLAEMEKGRVIEVVAGVNGRVIAGSELKIKRGAKSHVGELGISIRSGYREVCIGTEMAKTLVEESQRTGLKVLVLHVFANNNRTRHVYEIAGFKETGIVPKGIYRKNRYVDTIVMTLIL